MEPNFSGYVTKFDVKCTDGVTIKHTAFKDDDGERVPLVWRHMHDEPTNILGHMILEHRADGVYGYGYFNTSPNGVGTKTLVEHEDITRMSIYANSLVRRGDIVHDGKIREVSLVLAGANSEARIDKVSIAHEDGVFEGGDDEGIIYTDLPIKHETDAASSDDKKEEETGESDKEETVQDVVDTMSPKQQEALTYLIGVTAAKAKEDEEESDDKKDDSEVSQDNTDPNNLTHQEGTPMSRNVFDRNKQQAAEVRETLSHDQMAAITTLARDEGIKWSSASEKFAIKHGIENIELLFPDAKLVNNTPDLDARRTEWVTAVMSGVRKSPFSRIKSISANLLFEEARAKGYVKGNMKKEEFFSLTGRTTTPTTVYKKQKLDRDDIVDIVDLDVVAWVKAEMRIMLDEELARAILLGDGRAVDDEDKIKDPIGATEGAGIRSIVNDNPLYAPRYNIPAAAPYDGIDSVIVARGEFRGTGRPTLFTSELQLTKWLLQRDEMGRRTYANQGELESELRVDKIVPVELFDGTPWLVGIFVNLNDYTLGADRGGSLAMFDDFDIDFNQYKYLMETRLSGALTKIRSAIILVNDDSGLPVPALDKRLPVPPKPVLRLVDSVVTVTAVPHALWQLDMGTGQVIDIDPMAGEFLADGVSATVRIVPLDDYTFPRGTRTTWPVTGVQVDA